ncbi:unnamed protein product [marine sediment metagenome]|uniref:Uncharacterized protein n=1 Tax=marine sediment metagenome TaxID=412755 RepID=X0RKL5_9ZZZZ
MRIFGLVITTEKASVAAGKMEGKKVAGAILEIEEKRLAAVADRDSANRQVARLLHNSVELALLWGACRECGVEDRVRVVYDRLKPKQKGV